MLLSSLVVLTALLMLLLTKVEEQTEYVISSWYKFHCLYCHVSLNMSLYYLCMLSPYSPPDAILIVPCQMGMHWEGHIPTCQFSIRPPAKLTGFTSEFILNKFILLASSANPAAAHFSFPDHL